MACSMGTSVGYDRARNKVSGGPMAHPLAHCQLESRFQSDTFVSTLLVEMVLNILENNNLAYRARLPPKVVGVHPQNRGG